MLKYVVLLLCSCYMYYIYTQFLKEEEEEKGKESKARRERKGKEGKAQGEEGREGEREAKGGGKGKEGLRKESEGKGFGEVKGGGEEREDKGGGEEREEKGGEESEEKGEGGRVEKGGEREGKEEKGGEREEKGGGGEREGKGIERGGRTDCQNKCTRETRCRKPEMSLVNYVLLSNDWHTNFDVQEVFCSKLPPSSREYISVYDKITSTLTCNITAIERIENPFLLGCYLLKKQEYEAQGIDVKERELFHCTSTANISNIIRNNFDWRKTIRGKFGRGVSFSPFARYANKFANESIGDRRAMIVAKVLIGDVANGKYSSKIPPLGYDTTCGNNNRVFVKFNDYEFYPKFVAYYSF